MLIYSLYARTNGFLLERCRLIRAFFVVDRVYRRTALNGHPKVKSFICDSVGLLSENKIYIFVKKDCYLTVTV
ncbi:hypothetical protein HPT25_09485 [Bacillus sp. BRMEA1]|uniref:hypothetical protein n=1 Tax=Neobacillus endophyticus TaxID=2738405 RepID=UPI001564AF41|nr:hypothetical protein [Neobacillus endophyticus]NRD77675.1 hypothetical protein [Neobacillus endophyticus]